MAIPLKYFNVNWVNGMKINKDHFIHQENVFNDKLKDILAIQLNNRNYGLLPASGSENSSFEIFIKIDNQNSLKVKILQCRAVTRGGARIEILKNSDLPEFSVSMFDKNEKESDVANQMYYLILSVDIFAREPSGLFNSDEDPPRHPFVVASLKVNLISEKQISNEGINTYSFYIGKVNFTNGVPEIVDDYIPPCMSNMSHQKLVAFHSGIDKLLGKIEIDSIEIIRKIKEKDQSTNLAMSTQVLAENFLNFIGNNILDFRWNIIDHPPVKMFEKIASLARIIKNTIDCNTSSDKEEMLNYYTNWSDMKPGDFEKLLVQTINFNYDHHEIYSSIIQFSNFSEVIASLFEKLSSLAYIGKKKETGIFVKEHKSKRSYLAD